jgi:thiamine transport system permease protein
VRKTFTAHDVADVLSDPLFHEVLRFTFLQASLSTIATLIVGIIPAYFLSQYEFAGRRIVSALIIVPFMLPTVVVGSAFLALLPDRFDHGLFAIVLAHMFFNIAVIVRVVGLSWQHIPQSISDAAATLGARKQNIFRYIYFPLLRPSIISSALIVFLFTFTSFGAVQILGTPHQQSIEVEIVRQATVVGDVSRALVMTIVQLIILAVLVLVSTAAARRTATKFPLAQIRRQQSSASIRIIMTIFVVLISLPLILLALSSVHINGQWTLAGWRGLSHSEIRPGLSSGIDPLSSISTSLTYMFEATVISVAIGTLAALAIDAGKKAGRVLDTGLLLPLGTSAVTLGFAMLITFNHSPFAWRNSPWLIPLGHALIATPFVTRAILPTLRSRPSSWLDAAATLGASPIKTWLHIDVARLARPIFIGAGFAAAISLGEFGATTFLTRSGNETMPIAIARLVSKTGALPRTQAFALSTILAVMTIAIILSIELLIGRNHVER